MAPPARVQAGENRGAAAGCGGADFGKPGRCATPAAFPLSAFRSSLARPCARSASPWGCPWRLDRRCLARTRRATRTSAPPGYRSRERLACCGGLLNQAGPDRWPARWPADRAKKCCRGSPRSLACQPLRKLLPFCKTRHNFTRSFELRMALKSFFRSSVYSVAFGDGSVSILQIFL